MEQSTTVFLSRRVNKYALTAIQKTDARTAMALLEGSGLNLQEAARRAIDKQRAVSRVTIEHCADRFIQSRFAEKCRDSTIEFYTQKLSVFVAQFGVMEMDALSRGKLREWLAGQDVSESTRAGHGRAIRAMWRWAIAQEPPLAGIDITTGIKVSPPAKDNSDGFLPVPEVDSVLNGCGHHAPALALMLFAGVRPHEMAGAHKPKLLWRHISVSERLIRIPAEIAKTGRPRIIEGLPDALWHWIGAPGKPEQPISRTLAPEIIEKAALAAGYGERCARTRKWPHDALRHTFATYALALTADPGKVSHWMGHEGNPAMLYRHYRGLAGKAEAEKFFSLRPALK